MEKTQAIWDFCKNYSWLSSFLIIYTGSKAIKIKLHKTIFVSFRPKRHCSSSREKSLSFKSTMAKLPIFARYPSKKTFFSRKYQKDLNFITVSYWIIFSIFVSIFFLCCFALTSCTLFECTPAKWRMFCDHQRPFQWEEGFTTLR